MPPKRTSTSETPAITLDAIRQLIADLTTAVEAQTAAIASASNPNNLTGTPAVKMETYKDLYSFNPFYFNELTLKIPRITFLSPNMGQILRNLWKSSSGDAQSIEGNVTASKPQTLEEATNIAHRLMDQIIKRNSVQETNDHKRKIDDRRNTTTNNYPNNNNYSNNRDKDKYDRNNNNHSNNHIKKITTQITVTITTATIITISSKMEGRKYLRLMETMDIMDLIEFLNVISSACSDSLLLIPLCCDDIHDFTTRVSALAGCDSQNFLRLYFLKEICICIRSIA
ncbi:hypothetical protein Tco_1079158 [Tanacetum coccineum]|uniref:Uncharacterized protein n=1 Tax=Tanacetum coccineum TaxID=301880 RepID=A0ABQ5HRD1_9ASTR